MGGIDVSELLRQYEDAPAAEPMHGRPGEIRRNPSTDQAKVRRRMTTQPQRKQASDDDGIPDVATIAEIRRQASVATSLAAQQELIAKAEELESRRRLVTTAERALDMTLSEAVEIVPQGGHEMHTAATDWLMATAAQSAKDPAEAERAMVAQASLWFDTVPDFVKTHPGEFLTQAEGKARYESSPYGDAAEVGAAAFVAEAKRLHRQAVKGGLQTTASQESWDLSNGAGGGIVDGPDLPEATRTSNPFTDVPQAGSPEAAQAQQAHEDAIRNAEHGPPPRVDPYHAHTPHLDREIHRIVNAEDAGGVREMAQGYAGHVLRGGSLNKAAALRGESEDTATLGTVLAGFALAEEGAAAAEGAEGTSGTGAGGLGSGNDPIGSGVNALDNEAKSDASSVNNDVADETARELNTAASRRTAGLVHLNKPRGGNACGQDGESSSDINDVTCKACEKVHDTHTKESASQVPQVGSQGPGGTSGLPTDTFSSFGPQGDPQSPSQGATDPRTDSNRAPSLEEIDSFTGWNGDSVVPQGPNGADAANDADGPRDASYGDALSGDFPVGSYTSSARDMQNPGQHVASRGSGSSGTNGQGGTRRDQTWRGVTGQVNWESVPGDRGPGGSASSHTASNNHQRESSMDQAQCPTCAGSGHVATRKMAYSGLPQIDQIVNADESPGTTPYPTQVAFPLEGWGGSAQQGQENVQRAIQETEQQLDERRARSPLNATGATNPSQAGPGYPDASGWMSNNPPGTAPGGKGQPYPGYSTPVYDGSSNLGEGDPVYGFGGDNPNQPMSPVGAMEENDETNIPSQPYNPGAPHNNDQAYRQVSPGMTTQGSQDPFIAGAQDEILRQQALIRERTAQLRNR